MENKKPEELEYRMYTLSLRQLSSINKGCQGIHSTQEYGRKYRDEADYIKYVDVDKTIIMLDGGTSQDMRAIVDELTANNVKFAYFQEPDLDNLITSITFIADERIWGEDRAKSFSEYCGIIIKQSAFDLPSESKWIEYIGGVQNATILNVITGKRLSN